MLTYQSNLLVDKFGDNPSTKAQWGVVAGLLQAALPDGPDKDDYYRAFLDWVFSITSTKDLRKREAATLINWFMWDHAEEEFDTYREGKPFLSPLAEREFLAAVGQALKQKNDHRYLEFTTV